MARLKAQAVPVPQTRLEFEDQAATLADLLREIDRLNAVGAQEVIEAKRQAKHLTEGLERSAKALWLALSAYAAAHRDELLPKDRKSCAIAAGTIGWRTSTPAIKVEGDEDDIILWLEARGLSRFLREAVTLDKAALLAEPAVAVTIPGISIQQGETLFFKPLDLESELTLKASPVPAKEAV